MVMTPEKIEQELQLKSLHESIWWEEDDPRWLIGKENKLQRRKVPEFFQKVDLGMDSYIIVFTGWRGSGKSTSMTAKGLQAQYMYNMRLVANFPIEYRLNRIDGTSSIIKAEPLDLYKLLCFDKEYQNCLILIDESPDIISHMAASTWKNRLLNIFVRQLRKNRNSLFLGAQQFELIDKSMRWQTDIIVHCEDASRKYGDPTLARGEVVELEVLDNSGMWTGHTWEQEQNYNYAKGVYKRPGEIDVVYPRVLWGDENHKGVFDTYHDFDIWESLRKVDMNIGSYEIGDAREADATKEAYEKVVEKVSGILNSGNTEYKQRDFYAELDLKPKDKAQISKMLADSGVTARQTGRSWVFNFRDFDIKRFV